MDDMMQIWDSFVRDAPRLSAEFKPWLEAKAYQSIKQLREGQNAMVFVDAIVLLPLCGGCKHYECRFMEQKLPLPTVAAITWKENYINLGIGWKEVLATARALDNGSFCLNCARCGSTIQLGQEPFYIERQVLSEYFDLNSRNGRRVPNSMKDAVLSLFGSICADCKKVLSRDEATMDHIVAVSKGGRTEVCNLQVLCESCNNAKDNADPDVVDVKLTFPLRPPPSDGFYGVIW